MISDQNTCCCDDNIKLSTSFFSFQLSQRKFEVWREKSATDFFGGGVCHLLASHCTPHPPQEKLDNQTSNQTRRRDALFARQLGNKFNTKMNAVARQSAATATRALRASNNKTQKRGIVDWMTNYPDKVRQKNE